jgi:serine/threonine protein phosphatase 1
MRDESLEATLQGALDEGHSVWVIGDIHGHRESFEALLSSLGLGDSDHVLCIGDLIDRGPDSFGVVEMVRTDERIHSIMGNHEMLIQNAMSTDEGGRGFWLRIGGMETLESIPCEDGDFEEIAIELSEFFSTLPAEVVLRGHRIVHGGYDPTIPPEDHTKHQVMTVRSVFSATSPIDESRQVVVGHTPVQNDLVPSDSLDAWESEVILADGRPSVICIDTGIYLKEKDEPRLTALNLLDGSIIYQPRVEAHPK